MNLKEKIENNWLIIIITIFATGASTGWFLANNLLVKPRDYELERIGAERTKNYEESKVKQPDKSITTVPNEGKKENPKSSLKETSITIIDDFSVKKYGKILEKERRKKDLRQLTAMESGQPISKVGNGTYFFISFVYLAVDWDETGISLNRGSVNRFDNNPSKNFEIHKLQNGMIEIVGFLTDTAAASVSILDGKTSKEIALSPMPWESADTMVFIPINRIYQSKYRDINISNNREISVLDIKLR